MSTTEATFRKVLSRDLLETLFRFGLIVFLAVMCARVFAPFASLMIWGLILAVALEPLNAKLAKRMGGRRGIAATVLTLVGLLLLGVPTVMLGNSFATHVQEVAVAAQEGKLHIPAPSPSVAGWPIVGKKVHGLWSQAHTDLPAFVQSLQPKLADWTRTALGFVAGIGGALLLFLASFIIAGIIMAFGRSGAKSTEAILDRIVGAKTGVVAATGTATTKATTTSSPSALRSPTTAASRTSG